MKIEIQPLKWERTDLAKHIDEQLARLIKEQSQPYKRPIDSKLTTF